MLEVPEEPVRREGEVVDTKREKDQMEPKKGVCLYCKRLVEAGGGGYVRSHQCVNGYGPRPIAR